MTTGNKIMWKRGEIAPRSNFSSFPHYYIYIFLTSRVKLHIHLLNMVVQFIVFLTLSTLICRGTDISKCFKESLGIRDNESRLYKLKCKLEQVDGASSHIPAPLHISLHIRIRNAFLQSPSIPLYSTFHYLKKKTQNPTF